MKYMLDTDICIYAIREHPALVIHHLRKRKPEDICVSAITVCELEYGVNKSERPEQNAQALAQFLSPLSLMPFDTAAAREYGRVRAHLERNGNMIGALDALIAAHAVGLDCTLVTNNESEMKRVPRLKVVNWAR